MRNKTEKIQGFTLLETIIYIGLFGVVFLSITNAIISFYQTNRFTLEQMTQLDSARKGVAVLVSGIREATYSETGSYPIEAATLNSITFYADIDNDMVIEKVRYFLNGKDFMQGIIKPSGNPIGYFNTETVSTISQYIRNQEQGVSIFTFYDTNGTVMLSPVSLINIRYVKVNLIVNVNPTTMPNEFTLRSSAAIRNVKSNL
jgi:type II secretory pathway pseudopilin PulG